MIDITKIFRKQPGLPLTRQPAGGIDFEPTPPSPYSIDEPAKPPVGYTKEQNKIAATPNGKDKPNPNQPKIETGQNTPAIADQIKIQEIIDPIAKYGQDAIWDVLLHKTSSDISVADLQKARSILEQIKSGKNDVLSRLTELKKQKLEEQKAKYEAVGLTSQAHQIDLQIKQDELKKDIDKVFPPIPPLPIQIEPIPVIEPPPQPPTQPAEAQQDTDQSKLKEDQKELTPQEAQKILDRQDVQTLLSEMAISFDDEHDIMGLIQVALCKTGSTVGAETLGAMVKYLESKEKPIPPNLEKIAAEINKKLEGSTITPLIAAARRSGILSEEDVSIIVSDPIKRPEVIERISDQIEAGVVNKDTATAQNFLRAVLGEKFEFNILHILNAAGRLPANPQEQQIKAQEYLKAWQQMEHKSLKERLGMIGQQVGSKLMNSLMMIFILGQLTSTISQVASSGEEQQGH